MSSESASTSTAASSGSVPTSVESNKAIYKSGDQRVRQLVAHLEYIAGSADKVSSSRAALAELRQAIKDPLRGAKHVAPYLGYENKPDELWFYRIASLFALHRKHQTGVSLGDAFRRVSDDRGSDSIEGRFLALLSASSDQLFDRLIGAVTLLKADEQPLDWCRVLDDVLGWGRPEKPRQQRLARDYYRAPAEASGNDATVTTSASSSSAATAA